MAFVNDYDFLIRFGTHWKRIDYKEKFKTVMDMIAFSLSNLELPHDSISIKDYSVTDIIKFMDRRSKKGGDFTRDVFFYLSEIARKKVAPDADKERFYLKSVDCYFDSDYMDTDPRFVDLPV